MVIWILFAAMTAVATLAVLWPLSRRPETVAEGHPEALFYQDQVAEIERDAARGLLSPAEAEAAKAEAARRLLRSARRPDGSAAPVGEPALRRRRAASTLALSAVPLLALSIYGAKGSPQLPDQPLHARMQADPKAMDMAAAVARIEAHLAQNPGDGRGWEVIAPVYQRMGRFDEAARAFDAAIRTLGENPARLGSLGETLVAAKDGMVSAEARAAFERALALEPGNPRSRFYLALAAAQDGDRDRARAGFEALLKEFPADAPFVPRLREEIARLGGAPEAPPAGEAPAASEFRPSGEAAAAIAGLPPPERMAAIRSMVEGLAARLEAGGGGVEEWTRLIRSYAALGERDKAAAALASARERLGGDKASLDRIEELAQGLRIPQDAPRP